MKKHAKVLLLIVLAVLAGCLAGALGLRQTTANGDACRLYLPDGTSRDALCDTLVADGVLHSTTAFRLAASLLRLDEVRPGSYVVEPHMRTLSLVRKLRNGQQDPIRLTIGKFRLPQDLNDYLGQKLMHDTFDVSLSTFHLVLPDTYEVYWTITPEAFLQRMEREYNTFWRGVKGSEKVAKESERREITILASIVEEETNYGPEKPLIASVYLNRLRRGMPLQADPTVKYAVGDFTLRRILNRHLGVESPFNTYLHAGLPPAPICLPSKATIEAVLNAPETQYLYFCASPAMDGTHRFAATLAEHNRNAAAFHRALDNRTR